MIPFDWSKETLLDPVKLADRVELTAAFFEEEFQGSFTWADFQRGATSEVLDEDLRTYLVGDESDELSEPYANMLDLIDRRASWLGDAYPFARVGDRVHFVPSESQGKTYLSYLMLLVCTYHNEASYSSKELQNGFEDICKLAMKAMFPTFADVFLFSQNSDDRRVLGWSAQDAIPALAQKLNTYVTSPEDIPDTQREFGIDVIAVCQFDDGLEYPFFAFGQCTVQRNWWEKRHEAQAKVGLAGFITVDASHSNFLFIPHFPRVEHHKWSEDRSRTINCILCDRHRICKLLENSQDFASLDLPARIQDICQAIEVQLAATDPV